MGVFSTGPAWGQAGVSPVAELHGGRTLSRMSEQTSERIRFMVWAEEKGEATAEEAVYYLAKDAAELFVSERMPGIFEEADEEDIVVCVKHPDGKIEKFDVSVEISIYAASRS